jgi:hypothetical protein
MEKQIENPRKKKKLKQPNSAQPGRAPTPPNRWAPPISGGSLPCVLTLSLSLPSGARLSALVALACAFLSLSASCACFAKHQTVTPGRLLSLSLSHGTPLSVLPSPRPPWTSTRALVHVCRDPWPRRPHMHLSSFLSTACARTHFLVPFRTASLSLALCSRRLASPETRAHRAGHLAP